MVSLLIQENSSWMKEGGRREKTREPERKGSMPSSKEIYPFRKNWLRQRVKKRKGGEGRNIKMGLYKQLALHNSKVESVY